MTLEGDYRQLNRIEHDSFTDGMKGKSYFQRLAEPQQCFGAPISAASIATLTDT
jgi:hypothetical protein